MRTSSRMDAALRVLLSGMLMLGLVPTPALAEEAADAQEQEAIVELADEEGAPAEDAEVPADEAVAEEPAPADPIAALAEGFGYVLSALSEDDAEPVTLTVADAMYDLSNATVTVADQVFSPWRSDSWTKPEVTVKMGGTTLVLGEDYEVEYYDNLKAGTARVVVSGINRYAGTSNEATYKVSPLDLNSRYIYVEVGRSVYYDGTAKEPVPYVEAYDQNAGWLYLDLDTDYEIVSYENNVGPTTMSGKDASINLVGKGNYTGGRTVNFSIERGWIINATVADIPDQAYTGKEVKPALDVTINGHKLTEGIDYKVIYSDNVQVGTATVTIEGIGNFITETTATFNIVKRAVKPQWKKSGSRWWYDLGDGTYPASQFELIDGKTYRFDKNGWMVTGWTQVGQSWYYLKSSGEMVQSAWQKIGGKWYWFDSQGQMATGLRTIDGKLYYFQSSGAMKTGWQQVDGTWYYFSGSGAAATGWQKVSGKWYWFDSDGKMATGWKQLGGTQYYLMPSGAMATGWKQVGGSWYYFNGSGAMQKSRWIGNYYVDDSGVMLTNTYTPDGYWVNASGSYVVYWTPGGSVYHKRSDCKDLARSSTILSGTIGQSGKSRACRDCFH